MKLTFADIKNSEKIKTYIKRADISLSVLGYTEHSFAHVCKCADTAEKILCAFNYDQHTIELAKIAAYMHDIGNVINRADHAQSGAVMAFRILEEMNMDTEDIAAIIAAIGNHDEGSAYPVNELAAALILADKTDVRRSRVRCSDTLDFDIHDRVNYAVESTQLYIDNQIKKITLELIINTEMCQVIDYFEIFLQRMLLCRKAADFFKAEFKLKINGQNIM